MSFHRRPNDLDQSTCEAKNSRFTYVLEGSSMTKRRTRKGNWAATIAAGYYFFCLLMPGMAIGAEALKKMRIAIPSIVIDFAPLWIAREKGLFREERIEVEITYIQGN